MGNNMELDYEMFCYQCEQTANQKGCTKLGVCGKTPEVANLQDLLIFQIKGISCYARPLIEKGTPMDKSVVSFIENVLFTTLTNVNFDAEVHVELLRESQRIKEELRAYAGAPSQPTLHATYDLPQTKTEMLRDAPIAGIMYDKSLDPDIRSLRQTVLYGLKGISAYGHQARELGYYSDEADDFYILALEALTDDRLSVEELIRLTMHTGEMAIEVMKKLDELIEHDAGFNRNDFFTTALDAGKYDGHQCALPYETVPVLLFVNKSLLAKEQIEVPGEDWTWDDMYEICRKITKDVNGDGLLDQFGTYNYSWRNAVYTSGGRFYDGHQQQLPFTDSHVLDAIKYMKRLNDLNQGQSVTQEDFNKGNVAFMPLTFAEYRTYKTYPYRIKKYTKFQWDCITFPAGKEGENRSRVDSLLMGINSNTKHEKLAWEFLKQLTGNEEMQMDIFRYSQGVSVLKSVTGSAQAVAIIQEDMDEGEQVINSSLLYNVIENGVIEPKYQQYEQVMSLADGEISKILMENRNVDSSMKIFQRSITKYLQQQR